MMQLPQVPRTSRKIHHNEHARVLIDREISDTTVLFS